jgi:hypothetical protein
MALRIAFGPEAPAFGSWEWVALDLCRGLNVLGIETSIFRDIPRDCDIGVFVKFKPGTQELATLRKRCRLVYFPVDVYGSAVEIDADAESLRCFDLILVHCKRLVRYFSGYTRVNYLDHPLKFITAKPVARNTTGPVLWIGNRSNLAPVVDWVNRNPLPYPLWVLTDLPVAVAEPSPTELGFRDASIRIGRWTPDRHVEWCQHARAAFDIKDDSFRARHKPPAKALDFLACGIPFAVNSDSSAAEHVEREYGLRLPAPEDHERWLSDEYFKETRSLAARLRAELSVDQITRRYLAILAGT